MIRIKIKLYFWLMRITCVLLSTGYWEKNIKSKHSMTNTHIYIIITSKCWFGFRERATFIHFWQAFQLVRRLCNLLCAWLKKISTGIPYRPVAPQCAMEGVSIIATQRDLHIRVCGWKGYTSQNMHPSYITANYWMDRKMLYVKQNWRYETKIEIMAFIGEEIEL